MIVEGIVTTRDAEGRPHVAPMGAVVDRGFSSLRLRPFRSSTTYQHLAARRWGVFHVTDDVLLLAKAAVGALQETPPLRTVQGVEGDVLTDACRWYAFRVSRLDDSADRAELDCEIVSQGVQRELFGLNRAKHAVVEGAIMATRIHLLSREEIVRQMASLKTLVDKTGGDQEIEAFDFLQAFINDATGFASPT